MQQVKLTCTPNDGTAVPKCIAEQYKNFVLTEHAIKYCTNTANLVGINCEIFQKTVKKKKVLSE
jgi:hypothetical protein